MSKSDNTTLVIVIAALLLLLLFAHDSSLSFLFVSQTPLVGKAPMIEYWTGTAYMHSYGLSLGDHTDNSYLNGLEQKIFVPATFTVTKIMVYMNRHNNPAALGTFSIGIAETKYSDNFLSKTTFDPNIVEPFELTYWGYPPQTGILYNFTIPPTTVHNFTYVRFEYAGTTNNDGISDYLLLRVYEDSALMPEAYWYLSGTVWHNLGETFNEFPEGILCGVAGIAGGS